MNPERRLSCGEKSYVDPGQSSSKNDKRSKKASSAEPFISSASSTGSVGSRGKKKKFSFWSNLFKSKIPENEQETVTSASSYESVNSAATTNSFSFVSPKKYRGKGNKGKRIPMDEPTLPRLPPSGKVEGSSSRSNTLGRRPGKMGTLNRLGVKIGLKKKYNLQSCESLENIIPQAQVKKNGTKQVAKSINNSESISVVQPSPSTSKNVTPSTVISSIPPSNVSNSGNLSPVSASLGAELPTAPTSSQGLPNPKPLNDSTPSGITSEVKASNTKEEKACSSALLSQTENTKEKTVIHTAVLQSINCDDPSTWGTNTRRKRRAPAPPTVTLVPGKNSEDGNTNNVELKSVTKLNEDSSIGLVNKRESYPSGALRRVKSKDKFHRPCSCSNSIFAHHSKYQHRRSCSDTNCPNYAVTLNSTTTINSNTYTRSHVRGKKKAPAPPNPFEEASDDPMSSVTTSAKDNSKNYRCSENPYGNPFLDPEEIHVSESILLPTQTETNTQNQSIQFSTSKNHRQSPEKELATKSKDDKLSRERTKAVVEPAHERESTSSGLNLMTSQSVSNTTTTALTPSSNIKTNVSHCNNNAVKPTSIFDTPKSNPITKSRENSISNNVIGIGVPVSVSENRNETSTSLDTPKASTSQQASQNSIVTGSESSSQIPQGAAEGNTATINDEIAQNILNDIQEQEQLNSANSTMTPNDANVSTQDVRKSETPSSSTKSSSTGNNASKSRLFKFSSKSKSSEKSPKDMNVTERELQEAQTELETLLKSSKTLKTEADKVDAQVKAQLAELKHQSDSSPFLNTTPANHNNEPIASSSSSSGKTTEEKTIESPKVTPRPWYKRSITSPKSPSSSSKPKVLPKPTIKLLPKFSDLDNEAKKIVEENRRKSSELAFNDNAKELINMFNSTFPTTEDAGTSSGGTSNNVSTSDAQSPTTATNATITTTVEASSPSRSILNPTSPKPFLMNPMQFDDQKNVAVVQPQSKLLTSQKTIPSTTCSTTYTPSFFSARVSSTSSTPTTTSISSVLVTSNVTTNSNSTTSILANTSSTIPNTINAPSIPATSSVSNPSTTVSSTSAITSISNKTAATTISINGSQNTSSNTSNSTTTTTTFTKSSLEDWTCPRCTLKNSSWRALCEACYFRKFAAAANPITSIFEKINANRSSETTTTAAATTPSSTTTINNGIQTRSTVSSTQEHGNIANPNQSSNRDSSATTAIASESDKPIQLVKPKSLVNPSCENFMSQLPTKESLAREDKLPGINKLRDANGTTAEDPDVEELDIEKLRQVRLAFFAKEQQKHSQNNLAIHTSTRRERNANMSMPANVFLDGEDDSIDAILEIRSDIHKTTAGSTFNTTLNNDDIDKSTSRSEKSLPVSERHSISQNPPPIIQEETQGIETLQSQSNIISGATGTLPMRFRPMLESISEADANYYSTREFDRIYENLQQNQPVIGEVGDGYACDDENESKNYTFRELGFSDRRSLGPNIFMPYDSLPWSENFFHHPLMQLQMRQQLVNNMSMNPLVVTNRLDDVLLTRAGSPLISAPPQPQLETFSKFRSSNNPNQQQKIYPMHSGVDTDPRLTNSSPHFLTANDNSTFSLEETQSQPSQIMANRSRGQWNSVFGERQLSYEEYCKLGAIPKGYNYNSSSGSVSSERKFRVESPNGHRRKNCGNKDEARYFSESSEEFSPTENTLAVGKLLRKLEWAISNGEHRLAATLAHDLALLKVNCVMAKNRQDPMRIRVYVEDRFMQQGPFVLEVLPAMTLKDLKQKIENDWGIPMGFQKWILGKKIAEEDNVTLSEYEVINDTMGFLYLVTPQIEKLEKTSSSIDVIMPPMQSQRVSIKPIKQEDSLPLPPPPPLPIKMSKPEQTTFRQNDKVDSKNKSNENTISTVNKMKAPSPTPVVVRNIEGTPPRPAKIIPPTSLSENKKSLPAQEDITLYKKPSGPLDASHDSPKPNAQSKSSGTLSTINGSDAMISQTQPQLPIKRSTPQSAQKNSDVLMDPKSQLNDKTEKSNTSNVILNRPSSPSNASLSASLQKKLANLREAAEHAFGKSFGQSNETSVTSRNSSISLQNENLHRPSTITNRLQDDKIKENHHNSSQSKILPKSIPSGKKGAKLEIQDNLGTKSLVSVQHSRIQSGSPVMIESKPMNSSTKKVSLQNSNDDKSENVNSISPKLNQKLVNRSSTPSKLLDQQQSNIRKLESTQKEMSPQIKDQGQIPNNVKIPQNISSIKVNDSEGPIPKLRVKRHSLSESTKANSSSPVPTSSEQVPFKEPSTVSISDLKINKLSSTEQQITKLSKEDSGKREINSVNTPKPSLEIPPENSTSPKLPPKAKPTTTLIKDEPQTTKPMSPVNLSNSPVGCGLPTVEIPSTSSLTSNYSGVPVVAGSKSTKIPGAVASDGAEPGSPCYSKAIEQLPTKVETNKIQDAVPLSNGLKSHNIHQPTITSATTALPLNVLEPVNKTEYGPITSSPFKPPSKQSTFKVPYFMKEKDSKNTPSTPPMICKVQAPSSTNLKKFPTPSKSSSEEFKKLLQPFKDTKQSPKRKNSDSSIINMVVDGKPERVEGAVALDNANEEAKEDNIQTYLSMLQMMEKQDLILNSDPFECPVCLLHVPSNEGVTLRDCLHNFCKECLTGAVQYAEDSEVKCPFRDNNYCCNSSLQEREIKALVPSEVFEKYLTRSVKLAEMKMMNTFHCKTSDCTGWCIFEDDVNSFKCPVCTKRNCITCAAIHEDIDCQKYQRELAIAAETDENAKSSRLMLEKMIQRGEALECPACHVVLLKKWGCDWVRCSYCKTEICWVTKGFRWGPAGKGDMSGGCKCGVNGVRCHPKCTYCH